MAAEGQVEVRDFGIGELLARAPAVATFYLRRAVATLASDYKSNLSKQQSSKSLARFVSKGSSIFTTPRKATMRAARNISANAGPGAVSSRFLMLGQVAVAYEEGATISKGGIGMAVRHPRWARTQQFKVPAPQRVGGRTIAALAGAGGKLVWIRSKTTGRLTVFRDDSRNEQARRKRRRTIGPQLPGYDRRILTPIATFLNQVRIKPQLGAVSLIGSFGPVIDLRLQEAANGIAHRLRGGK